MAIEKISGANPLEKGLTDQLKEYADAVTKKDMLNKKKPSPMAKLKEEVNKNNLEPDKGLKKGTKINLTG